MVLLGKVLFFWVKDWEQSREPPFYTECSQKNIKSQRNLPITLDQKSISNRRNCKLISGSKGCTKTVLEEFSENHRLALPSNSRKTLKNRIWNPFLAADPYKTEYPDLFLGTLSIKWYYWGRCCFWMKDWEQGRGPPFYRERLKKDRIPEKPANHTGPKIHFK